MPMNRNDYNNMLNTVLTDHSKLEKLKRSMPKGNLYLEDQVNHLFKNMKNKVMMDKI